LADVELRFVLRDGFSADSAFLQGHFPGNPIVPGAMILAYLSAHLAEAQWTIARVSRMKFSHVLRPETPLEIDVASRKTGVRAVFRSGQDIVASADLVLRAV
jgi:3-hydroxymyristoyl/3-hydroxydecanoyl-(acyl carrier protein) dehydratase